MKKVIITTITIMVAFVVNAASYNWKVSNLDSNLAPGYSVATDMTAYLIDSSVSGYDYATVSAAFSKGEGLALLTGSGVVSSVAGSSFVADGMTGTEVQLTYTDASHAAGTTYNYYAVLISKNEAYYLLTTEVGAKASTAGARPLNFNLGSSTVNPSGWQPIPEPTSGLLLLVGGALLALRRKQK